MGASIAHEALFASRAMQALEVLAFGPATVTQIAAALNVHPRTARRLLNRMAYDGWLRRHDGPRPTYTPTLRIVALAAQLADREALLRHARALAGDLHTRTGQAVHLAIPSYRSTLRLLRGADGHVLAIHDLLPAHVTAAGKLLLAHRQPWRESVLGAPLAALTDRTLTDPQALRADLEGARARGYALEADEHRLGVRAVAAPITSAGGEVIAALALSTAEPEHPTAAACREAVIAAAAALSSRLATSA